MTTSNFDVHVRQMPGIAILDLEGEINAFAEQALSAAYADAETSNPEMVLLNFENLEYMNSTGIALIVSLLAKARAAKRKLLASGLSEHYVEIFNITRLADFMEVFPDETTAISSAAAVEPHT